MSPPCQGGETEEVIYILILEFMFNNPFTPESQKAKKSLFNKKATINIGRLLSANQLEKIKKIGEGFELEEYGNLKIRKDQIQFLYDLEKALIGVTLPEFMTSILDEEQARDYLLKVKKAIGVDRLGNITRLTLSNTYFGALPHNINLLKKLDSLYLSKTGIRNLPKHLENLKELEILLLSGNEINSREKERIRKDLPNTEIKF